LAERGQRGAARELLAPTYNWFTEGLDKHDLNRWTQPVRPSRKLA